MVIGIETAHANKLNRTGVEEYCFQIIQELKKIIPTEVRVILYTNEPLRNGLEQLPGNWEERVLRWPLKKLWSQVRLSLELLFHPPDIFFAPGQLIPFITPLKTITMIHDSAFVAYPAAYRFWGRRYLRVMNRCIIRKSVHLLTSSTFNKTELSKYYGAPAAAKTSVVPLAFNSALFYADVGAAGITQKYGITKPFIMTAGRLEAKKNTHRLVEAFNHIKEQHDIQLVLVGVPGYGYDLTQKTIAASQYRKDIIIPGYVGQSDLPALVASCRVFVFPSAYEGFGIPLLEAMAVGAPVVASNRGALPEVGGDAVYYADPDDPATLSRAIVRFLEDGNERRLYSARGLERAKSFSWAKTATTTWNEIVKVMGS